MQSSSRPDPTEVRLHFVLRGSFYPLHKGHTNLFRIARQYVSGLPWPEHVKISFGSLYLSPTSTKSLARKHGCAIDHRDRVERLTASAQDLKIDELVTLPHYDLHGVPSSKIIGDLRRQIEEACSNDRLVQICGVDSKVEAIVGEHLSYLRSKRSRKKQSRKKDGDVYPQMAEDLRLVLVVDGRGVPLENESVVQAFPHVARIRSWTGSMEPADLLPRSSTMQRFIEAAVYYPGQGATLVVRVRPHNGFLDPAPFRPFSQFHSSVVLIHIAEVFFVITAPWCGRHVSVAPKATTSCLPSST